MIWTALLGAVSLWGDVSGEFLRVEELERGDLGTLALF